MTAPDRSQLYFNRIDALMKNPKESAGLGLYRIGFEAGYDLHLREDNQRVTVVATRGIHGH
jgi:hypothetical protein